MAYNIIILEDDDTTINNYKREVGDNEAFELIICKNILECKKQLYDKTKIIHGAIMDLKVPEDNNTGSEKSNQNGINFLIDFVPRYNFPAIVVTAQPNAMTDEAKNKLPDTIKIMTKESTVYKEAFKYFKEKKDLLDMAPYYQNISKELQEEISNSFWYLCDNWGKLKYKFSDDEEKKMATKRHIINQLQEAWKDDMLHYSEFYVLSKNKKDITTGDIIKYEENNWVVVTPPCNLSNGKTPEYLTLLKCVNSSELTNKINSIKSEKEENARKAARELFTKDEKHEFVLPAWADDVESCVIDFKSIRTIIFDEETKKIINNEKNRLASISSKFLPNLMQKYGFYISRLGQPEICPDSFLQCVTKDK